MLSFSQFGVGDRVSAAAPFGYALLSPPLVGRSGRARCSVLLRRGGALRFRGVLTFFTSPGTWATSSKTVSLGLSAWTVVVLPFRDAFAVFRLRVLSVGAGELAFLDCGATDLAFLRGLRRVITKVDSKVRSLESSAWTVRRARRASWDVLRPMADTAARKRSRRGPTPCRRR